MSRPSRRALLGASLSAAVAGVAAACGRGNDGAAGRPPAGAVTLAIVGIIAADLDRSLRFYRRLGLDVPASVDGTSYVLELGAGNVLFWETPAAIRSFDPTWTAPPAGDRRIVVEFGFDDPDAMEAAYAALVAAGAPSRLAPFDQGRGVRYAIVVDPDGNQVSLRYPQTRRS